MLEPRTMQMGLLRSTVTAVVNPSGFRIKGRSPYDHHDAALVNGGLFTGHGMLHVTEGGQVQMERSTFSCS